MRIGQTWARPRWHGLAAIATGITLLAIGSSGTDLGRPPSAQSELARVSWVS